MMRLLAALLALLFFGSAGAAPEGFVVGTDIGTEEITDFFYTLDASTYPPHFQRYRFYTEDGKRMFFHESRQNGGWPQTEEDTVASGTVELTEELWYRFLACLRDGTVSERNEEVLDGDAGPWQYLYWTGDEGKYQEFRFASPAKRSAFERLCSELADNHRLIRFRLSRGGYMPPQSCEILLRSGNWFLSENDGRPIPLEAAYAEEIEQILEENGAESWDGFHESDPRVLDGEGFSLKIVYADGTSVRASGENAFPPGYRIVTDRINEVLTKEKMSRLAGIYRYDGTGFGGDFTLTLAADGTWTFSEGPLSSYLGGGTWNVYDNALYMDEENGLDLSCMFIVDEDVLYFYASGSGEFPHVEVPDGGRFLRLPAAED